MKIIEIKKEISCRLNLCSKEFYFDVYYNEDYDYIMVAVKYNTEIIRECKFPTFMVDNDFKINNMVLHIINDLNHYLYNKIYNVEMINEIKNNIIKE